MSYFLCGVLQKANIFNFDEVEFSFLCIMPLMLYLRTLYLTQDHKDFLFLKIYGMIAKIAGRDSHGSDHLRDLLAL